MGVEDCYSIPPPGMSGVGLPPPHAVSHSELHLPKQDQLTKT